MPDVNDAATRPAERTPSGRIARFLGEPRRLFLALLVALALPLLFAFALFEDPLRTFADGLLDEERSCDAIALIVALLLAGDVLLPVPSSLVATLAASMLDAPRAIVAIAGGTVAGSTLGWCLGRFLRGAALARIVEPEALRRADASFARWGLWAYACTRTIPILAEEFAILAGAHRVRLLRVFLPVTIAASLPVAILYAVAVRIAGLGHDDDPPFWALFVVASALPLAGLAALRLRRRDERPSSTSPDTRPPSDGC
jgi:membrane protein DedA with SNARE-associated domain